jgi:hypothetical protein
MAADHKDPAKFANDKQQLATDELQRKTDLARLSAALAADVLHWSQILRTDRVALSHDLRRSHK